MAPDAHRVLEMRALSRRPSREEAEKLLERVALQVQPIMRSRKWRCLKLTEMFPKNPNLLGLNINRGQEIKIRLRAHYDETSFLPFHDLVGTMLHELTHNVHGPHNTAFYKLLDEIRAECEELMSRGISGTGEGFDAPSCGKLGGTMYVRNPPERLKRQTMLRAAEQREARSQMLPPGGRKLGGDANQMRQLRPRDAASQAAERRLRDNVWCPNEDVDLGGESSSSASYSESLDVPHVRTIIDLTGSDEEEPVKVYKRTRKEQLSHGDQKARCDMRKVVDPQKGCSCQWDNRAVKCSCLLHLQARGSKNCTKKTWSCKSCTLINDESLSTCLACGLWRYSSGPPVGDSKVFTT